MVLDFLAGLAAYGYLGVFAMALIGSATVIFPVPYFVVIFGLATTLDPLLLTAASAVGSAIGELTAFFFGKYGSRLLIKKHGKWLKMTEVWFKRNGFLTLVFLAAAPLPTDIGGIVAGALGYGKAKFFLAMLIGKAVKFGVIVYAGYYSITAVTQYLGYA